MKGDDLVEVVDVKHVRALPAEAASLVVPIASQSNQVGIQLLDSGVGDFFGPVNRVGVSKILVFENLKK